MNMRTFTVALCAALASVNFAFAQSAAPEPSDDSIVAAVKTALAAKPALKADSLKITSKKGEVTIAGPVDNGHRLYEIAETAQKVPGVKTVNNEMLPKK